MTLGASALGQSALGALLAVEANYVDCEAQISITSQLVSALSLAGQIHIAGAIAIQTSIQSQITINEPVFGSVNISAAITMLTSLTSAITALQPQPNPGVSFSMTDKAGGA